MFVRLGWEAIEEHYVTSQRTVRRWMSEVGEIDLIRCRRSYLRKVYAARGIASIAGRKPGKGTGLLPEMSAANPALAWMPVRRMRRTFAGEIRPAVPALNRGRSSLEH